MKRWYNLQQFRRAVRRLREQVADFSVTTDVIVGFPGETDQEFEETCEFVQEIGFAKIHVFPFSARRNTAAARMDDQVPPRVREQRSASLRQIDETLHSRFVASQIGRDLEALVEKSPDPTHPGRVRWSGLTGNYLRVYFESDALLENRFVVGRAVEPYADGVLAAGPLSVR
jgi:threonylcarbamoyladenosine tRNA methylthiotransferase MtaB